MIRSSVFYYNEGLVYMDTIWGFNAHRIQSCDLYAIMLVLMNTVNDIWFLNDYCKWYDVDFYCKDFCLWHAIYNMIRCYLRG